MMLWKRNLIVCWFGSFITASGMNQITPFLPLYIEKLGIHDTASIERWAGISFGATFLFSAIVSPVWGRIADKYGRKPMLIRASLGMAFIVGLMGLVQNVYELASLRLCMGLISGFIPAAITIVATQTPKERSGWALGTLSTGMVSGMLLGPLIGGYLAETIGIRNVFYVTSGLLLISFLASLLFIKEDFEPSNKAMLSFREVWSEIPNTKVVISMFITTFILQLANMSINPIITVYIKQLSEQSSHIELISGLVVSAAGLANILAAPWLGKLSDQIGAKKVLLVSLIFAGTTFIPQAFVQSPWQLMFLRFLLGLATAGLLPCINTLVRQSAPNAIAGRVFGYNQSAQNFGSLSGAVLGGQMAASLGIHYVFFSTGALLLLNALWVHVTSKRIASQNSAVPKIVS
jgi:MFS transporter, DHA1 family, multidrug resistance protein